MNIAAVAFSLLTMGQVLQHVTAQRCPSNGFKGCECNILGACDYLDDPVPGLDDKFTGYAPIGVEQFRYNKSPQDNLAYLCESQTMAILYDCNAKIPLYSATMVNQDQLRGEYHRGEDRFKQSVLLGGQFQQGPADYKSSNLRQACYETVREEYLTEVSWFEEMHVRPGKRNCLDNSRNDVKSPISKGHLIASRYGKTILARQEATFTFTNIVPQFESFNNDEWKEREHYLIDDWGKNICASSLHEEVKMFIVVGAIPSTYTDNISPRFFGKSGFSNFEGKSNRRDTYADRSGGGEYRVNMPSYMWTAACCTFMYRDQQGQLKDGTKSIAFYRSNDPGQSECIETTPKDMIKKFKREWTWMEDIHLFPKNSDC